MDTEEGVWRTRLPGENQLLLGFPARSALRGSLRCWCVFFSIDLIVSFPSWQTHASRCSEGGQLFFFSPTETFNTRANPLPHLYVAIFANALADVFNNPDLWLWRCSGTERCIRASERRKALRGSLYAISNGLRFISHIDDFRPGNGAASYLLYDQWQYISALSSGTALLHLLVLAVGFSAVQFEQQRLFAAVICCHFQPFFFLCWF